jgi:RNA polymerase sigma-70 factor (ECF subfamily)
MDITLCLNSRDDELLAAVAEGDHDAFAEIYDRFAPYVFGRASGESADSAGAHEMVRSVFLELWRQAPRLDLAKENVADWLSAGGRARLA